MLAYLWQAFCNTNVINFDNSVAEAEFYIFAWFNGVLPCFAGKP